MRTAIAPHQLASALAGAPAGIEMLSLACFDTLIWRSLDRAEDLQRHCYGFRPAAELIEDAKRRGLRVAIVSNTQLDRAALATLIGAVCGAELLAKIDYFFCASEFGVSKKEGLFRHVLRATGIEPSRILHIGPDRETDYEEPRSAGLRCFRFVRFDSDVQERFRLESVAARMINEAATFCQPHRAAIAIAMPVLRHPAKAFGYASLGPIFHAYSRWLADEAAALQRPEGRIHLLFASAGGHLPQRVFEAMGGAADIACAQLEISRFTATAVTLTDEEAVLGFVRAGIGAGDAEALLRQLLFTQSELFRLLRKLPVHGRADAILKAVRTPANMTKIVQRSRAMAERLIAHVRRQADLRPGDTLILAGLGDDGIIQERVQDLIGSALDVRVAARLLLLRERSSARSDRKGMLDRRHHGSSALHALSSKLGLLRQLATSSEGGSIDYRADGRAVGTGGSIDPRQIAGREGVQQGCIRFALERDEAFIQPPLSDGAETRRTAAAAALARLIFLPLPEELQILRAIDPGMAEHSRTYRNLDRPKGGVPVHAAAQSPRLLASQERPSA